MFCVQHNIRYTIILEKKESVCNHSLLISPGLSRLWWEYLFTKSSANQLELSLTFAYYTDFSGLVIP